MSEMGDNHDPFVLLKFLVPDPEEPGEVIEMLEIGRREWLKDKDGSILCAWPSHLKDPTKLRALVTTSGPCDDSWDTHECEIVSAYANYLDAHIGLKKRLEDSAYETEKDLGRGRRKKKRRPLSDSEDDEPIAKQLKVLPKPPTVPQTSGTIFRTAGGKTSPIKVVAPSDRQTSNQNTMKIARKDRGTKASTFEELKKSLEKKKAEAAAAQVKRNDISKLVRGDVKATSPGWKSISSRASTSEVVDRSISEEVDEEGLDIFGLLSPLRSKVDGVKKDLFGDETEESNSSQISDEEDSVKECGSPSKESPTKCSSSGTPTKSSSFRALMKSSSTGTSQKSNFEENVLLLLHEINLKAEVISANQTKLNLHLPANEKVLWKPEGMPTVPLKTKSDVRDMERVLSEKPDYITNLSIYLSSFVSKDISKERDSAKNVMAALICNSVAKNYSLRGLKGKKPFDKSDLWAAVKGAMLLKIETDLKAKVTSQAVAMWLANAGWRKQSDGTDSRQKPRSPKKKSPQKSPHKSSHKSPAKSPSKRASKSK